MNYLYYRLSQLLEKVPTNKKPALSAMFIITMANYMNLFTLFIVINSLTGFFNVREFTKDGMIVFSYLAGICLMLLNYFFLFRRREVFSKKYLNESKQSKIIGNVLFIFYFVGSFALLYVVSKAFPV